MTLPLGVSDTSQRLDASFLQPRGHGRFRSPPAGTHTGKGFTIERIQTRVNDQIRISPIRVVGSDGQQLGIIPTEEALTKARDAGLDLVEVAPNERPPVCRIMDYGKFKYEQNKKDRKARSKQQGQALKEVKFRPKIEKHDLEVKVKRARKFLGESHKVKVTMNFRGREVTHAQLGRQILERVAKELEDIGQVESHPRMEGRHMIMLLAPRPGAAAKTAKKEEAESDE